MITLACIRLATTPPEELVRPPPVQVDGLPNLFGACVYSFMCHHVGRFLIWWIIRNYILIYLFSHCRHYWLLSSQNVGSIVSLRSTIFWSLVSTSCWDWRGFSPFIPISLISIRWILCPVDVETQILPLPQSHTLLTSYFSQSCRKVIKFYS